MSTAKKATIYPKHKESFGHLKEEEQLGLLEPFSAKGIPLIREVPPNPSAKFFGRLPQTLTLGREPQRAEFPICAKSHPRRLHNQRISSACMRS